MVVSCPAAFVRAPDGERESQSGLSPETLGLVLVLGSDSLLGAICV